MEKVEITEDKEIKFILRTLNALTIRVGDDFETGLETAYRVLDIEARLNKFDENEGT